MKSMELFFELMDYDFLILAVEKKNITIKGFTNIKKAPKNLIRNVIKMRFSNEKKFLELVSDIFDEKSKEYKGLSLESFLKEFYMSSSKTGFSTFETYGIFVNLFPFDAEKLCDKISVNIESGKHMFSGLLGNKDDITEENCISIIEKYFGIGDEISFIESSICEIENMLTKLTRKNEYETIKKSIKNKSMVDICRELGDFSESFDESLLWLAFISSNLEFIKKDKNRMDFFNKLLINIHLKINSDFLNYKKDKIEYLEEECLEKDNKISTLNKSINELDSYLLLNKEALRICEENIKGLNEKIMKNVSFNFNESGPNIIVITNFAPDRVMDSIGNYIVISPDNIGSSNDMLINFKGVVFIDRGSIDSTKVLLKLEDYLEKLNLKKVTVFSKNIEELVESIIISKFTLEG